MTNAQHLKLVHCFPHHMNIYGDWGNIVVLTKRCQWRGIQVEYVPIHDASDFDHIASGDLFFWGGGQDADQMLVSEIIAPHKARFIESISRAVVADKVFLLVCGGYQMFGRHFVDANGTVIPGLGILDIETKAPGLGVKERCIGNVIIQTELSLKPQTIVGFENHGGQTTFVTASSQTIKPLGKIIKGHGNTINGTTEGCVYRNVIGTYLHGPVLPKNPHLADYLIAQALRSKYDTSFELGLLDDTLEMQAHTATLNLRM